jgi:hypothetical protein
MEETQEKVIKADAALKKKIIIFYVVVAIVGVIVFKLSYDYLQEMRVLAQEDIDTAADRMLLFIHVWLVISVVAVLGVGGYLLWFALRVLRSGQMPPPGTRVIRDMRVIEGEKATKRAKVLIIASVLLVIIGLLVTWQTFSSFSTRMQILKEGMAEQKATLMVPVPPEPTPSRGAK